MKFKSAREQWQHYGKHYGYPQCCIDQFCYGIRTRSQYRAGNHTGFLPCKKHSRLVLLRELTLKDLISKRVSLKPFR